VGVLPALPTRKPEKHLKCTVITWNRIQLLPGTGYYLEQDTGTG
jgi:hypothetical protein